MKLYSTIVSITTKTFCGAHYIFRQFNYFLKLFTKITWEDTNFDSSQFCNFAPPLPNEIFFELNFGDLYLVLFTNRHRNIKQKSKLE